MFRWILHLAAVSSVVAALFLIPCPALAEGPEQEASFVPGEVLVKFKEGLAGTDEGKVKKELGLNTLEQITGLDVQKVQVNPGDEKNILEQLKDDPSVEYAGLNYVLRAVDTYPNDTYFNPSYSAQWGLSKIDAPAAWDVFTGTASITIAVVDTGVAQSHEDLSSKIVSGYNYWGGSPEDNHHHGTHVAGIASAATNNGKGVAGVSWGAKIMPVKVLDSSGSGTSYSVASGITYAADNGARVINLSLGGYGLGSDQTLSDAVSYAYNQGCLLVAAAGNDSSSSPLYPAAFDHVVAVAATDSTDARAWFSNYGSYVDVAAPGVSIYSTLLSNSYGSSSGTSMATPFVSGLAALIWSLAPDLTNDEIEEIIENTAVDLGATGRDNYFGWGRIDAAEAVTAASYPLLALGDQSTQEKTFFLADEQGVVPITQEIDVLNKGGDVLTWTATISPAAPWLSIVPPDNGIATRSSPGSLVLSATQPAGYGYYTATLVITSDTPNVQSSPQEAEVYMHYLSELYSSRLLLIYKQYSP